MLKSISNKLLPFGVRVAQETLNLLVWVRILHRQPVSFSIGNSYKSITVGFEPLEEGALPSFPAMLSHYEYPM